MKKTNTFILLLLFGLGCSGRATVEEATSAYKYYCDGSHVVRNPSYSMKLKYTSPQGILLSDAAKKKSQAWDYIKEFLQNSFFANMAADEDCEARCKENGCYDECRTANGRYNPTRGKYQLATFIAAGGKIEKDEHLHAIYDWYAAPTKHGRAIGEGMPYWQNYFAENTKIQEATNDDGTKAFSLTLDMGPFCKSAVRSEELYTK